MRYPRSCPKQPPTSSTPTSVTVLPSLRINSHSFSSKDRYILTVSRHCNGKRLHASASHSMYPQSSPITLCSRIGSQRLRLRSICRNSPLSPVLLCKTLRSLGPPANMYPRRSLRHSCRILIRCRIQRSRCRAHPSLKFNLPMTRRLGRLPLSLPRVLIGPMLVASLHPGSLRYLILIWTLGQQQRTHRPTHKQRLHGKASRRDNRSRIQPTFMTLMTRMDTRLRITISFQSIGGE